MQSQEEINIRPYVDQISSDRRTRCNQHLDCGIEEHEKIREGSFCWRETFETQFLRGHSCL